MNILITGLSIILLIMTIFMFIQKLNLRYFVYLLIGHITIIILFSILATHHYRGIQYVTSAPIEAHILSQIYPLVISVIIVIFVIILKVTKKDW